MIYFIIVFMKLEIKIIITMKNMAFYLTFTKLLIFYEIKYL